MKPAMMRSTISLAVIALFAAGCSSMPMNEASNDYQQSAPHRYVGPAGAEGSAGYTHAQGYSESARAAGYTGARGYANPSSNQSWSYSFDGRGDDALRADRGNTREIANYLNQNPSSSIMIDGQSERSVQRVAEALASAGVPTSKMQAAVFTDPSLRNDQRVDVRLSN